MKVDGEILVGKDKVCAYCEQPKLLDGKTGLCYDCNRGHI